jgi:hypothetical protein
MGDVALKRGEKSLAGERFSAALGLFERIPDPYSIAWSLARLARLLPAGPEMAALVERARAALASIDRGDLVDEVNREFGPPQT